MAQSTSGTCSVTGQKPPMNYLGTIKKNCETDEEYAAFLGVPYAKVPEGMDRYQPAESLPSELEPDQTIPTYEANITRKYSTQVVTPKKVIGSPDCLYMNIFVPKKPELIDELLPVLVYIHGGGFTFGSGAPETYTPDSIIKYGLIFVTINYRLGVNGFLNLHHEDFPGNVGLKDQVKALEWIRDNIEYFKGDPNNVTLSGCSAGGTCVNLHLIAPISKDLFHKAIIQSGGVFSPWGYRGRRGEQARVIMSDMLCLGMLYEDEDLDQLHFRTNLLFDADRMKRHPQSLTPYFGPSTETVKDSRAFLPDHIENMMKKVKHDKPVMAGITKEEGIHLFCINKNVNYASYILEDQHFRQLLMDSFRWDFETANKFYNEIRNRYFPNRFAMSDADKDRCFAKLARDLYFRRFYDGFKFGPLKSTHKNLYVYRFDHFSELSCSNRPDLSNFRGSATHGDDLKYLFCSTNARRDLGEYIDEGVNQNREIRLVMNHMCSLWANFCKTGVPKSDVDDSVVWRPHTDEEPCYLSIDTNLVLKEESLFKEEWDWLNAIVNEQPTVKSLPPSPN